MAALAEAISKAISAPIDFAGQDIRLTASIGLVTWVENNAVPDDLMKERGTWRCTRPSVLAATGIEPFSAGLQDRGFRPASASKSDLRRALRTA